MCCSDKVSKVILVVINVIFIILGLALFILGLLAVVNEDVLNEEVFPALQSINIGATNLGDTAKGLSITLIVFGAFVLILSMLGACGACCEVRLCLCIYMVIVAILFIGKFVIVILWIAFNAEVQSSLKKSMKDGLKQFSEDTLTSHELSSGWNYLNMQLKCCGIDPVTSSTNDYDSTVWQSGSPATDIPLSCCPSVSSSNYAAVVGDACSNVASGSTPTGHYSKGCYDALRDFAEKYSVAFIVVGVFILLVEIFAVIFACVLCCSKDKTGIRV